VEEEWRRGGGVEEEGGRRSWKEEGAGKGRG